MVWRGVSWTFRNGFFSLFISVARATNNKGGTIKIFFKNKSWQIQQGIQHISKLMWQNETKKINENEWLNIANICSIISRVLLPDWFGRHNPEPLTKVVKSIKVWEKRASSSSYAHRSTSFTFAKVFEEVWKKFCSVESRPFFKIQLSPRLFRASAFSANN